MKKDTSTIMVMSETTWQRMRQNLIDVAPHTDDPIGHIGRFKGIDLVIDEEVPDNAVEVYERWQYEFIKRGK